MSSLSRDIMPWNLECEIVEEILVASSYDKKVLKKYEDHEEKFVKQAKSKILQVGDSFH